MQEPGRRHAVRELTNKRRRKTPGLVRHFVQGRTVIEEEIRIGLFGQEEARLRLDDAVKRGNEILRQFEAANK